jgi:DNA-binding Lrp family transcriptional regulator
MAENEEQARIDKYIWRYTGVKSIRQISEELGIAPDAVMRRRQELRDEIDVLSVQESQHKVLTELQEVAQILRDKLDNVSDERNFSGIANSFVNAMKTVNAELKAMEKRNTDAVDSLNRLRVQELLRLIDLTVAKTLTQIADENDLDESTLLAIFQSHLKPAAEELEA